MTKLHENKLTLYHGSRNVITAPTYGIGNPHNDYGLGFYCTIHKELACEWSCPTSANGVCNEYTLNTAEMNILNLNDSQYSVLNWLAVLVDNRIFDTDKMLVGEMKQLLLEEYLVSFENVDIVIGYRADDSYFSFARAFLEGSLCLRCLEEAFYLGELGNQIVLKSQKAFDALKFVTSEEADAAVWHPRRAIRDTRARDAFLTTIRNKPLQKDDIFALDILRKNMPNGSL